MRNIASRYTEVKPVASRAEPAGATVQLVRVGLVRDAGALKGGRDVVSRPSDVARWLTDIRTSDREQFICLHLNARNQVNALEVVSIGTLNASLVHPREVFKGAILNNAAGVILAHNHPSDDPTPSSEDQALTRRMVQAGEIMGINVLDHVIVGPGCFLSMKESNLM